MQMKPNKTQLIKWTTRRLKKKKRFDLNKFQTEYKITFDINGIKYQRKTPTQKQKLVIFNLKREST